MKIQNRKNEKYAIFESSERKIITCPHCWTDQRSDRDFCYRCGAEFVYLRQGTSKMEPILG